MGDRSTESATWRPLATLTTLYLAQGLVAGFGAYVLLPQLQARGVDLATHAWFLASGGVPWVLKFLWAPALDRLAGPDSGRRRRRVVVALQLLCAGATALLAVSLHAPLQLARLAGVWTLVNLFLALQDVAVDTLAIDAIPAARRGLARGLMQLGMLLGSGWLGSVALARVAAQDGLTAAVWTLALALALLASAPLLLRGADLGAPGGARDRDRRALRRAFAQILEDPRTLLGAVLALLAVLADGATQVIAYPFFLEHLGWTPQAFATQLAPVVSTAQVIAYAASALVVDRLGHARALAIATVALGGVYMAWGLLDPLLGDLRVLYGLVGAEGLASALLNTALLALLMDLADTRARATHFVVYMALINLSRLVLGRLLGPLPLAAFGFAGAWICLGALQCVALAPALLLARVGPAPREP
ncbi:MAG: MFS transporter [Myxococcales bacterium]|nr:MFS transporter [Myxococcales bacterium]